MDRCALFVDAGYLLADGAMAAHGTRHREAVSWDYTGLLRLLNELCRERTGLPLLRCYWYEATVEGRHTPEHDTLGDIPGLKLRLSRIRPGRREGVDAQVHRDLMTLARNNAICDAVVISGDEDLTQVVCDAQDLGIRVTLVHIAADGGWGVSRSLRQECDDLIEIGGGHLRPYVSLLSGAGEASSAQGALGAAGAAVALSHAVPPGNGSRAGYEISPGSGYGMSTGNGVRPGYEAVAGNGSAAANGVASSGNGTSPEGSAPLNYGGATPSNGVPSHRGMPSGNGAGHGSGHGGGSGGGHSGGHGGGPGHDAGNGVPPAGGTPSGGVSPDGAAPQNRPSHGSPSQPAYPGYAQESPPTSPAPAVSAASSGSQPGTQPGPHHGSTGSMPAVPPYGSGNAGSTGGAPGYQLPTPYTGPQPTASQSQPQPQAQPQPIGPYTGPQAAPVPVNAAAGGTTTLADAVKAAHKEGHDFGESVAKDAPALWLEAVLARKPRMPSDLEARLLQGSSLPIDFLLHDEVRHALRRGFWDALERARH
ncbi:nuclease [Planomonospora sphaerica]|uniref:Nuclease n=1 Tax=Planomonospora sphaerica TaxID=161355 RepID=A0A171DBH1_9ACTN|nr:NYN domain-containing protein [Planomonospora sphaerica]GAT67921.1 nuclease [Planomonospora sphaerica]